MRVRVPRALAIDPLPHPVAIVGDVHLAPAPDPVLARFLAFLERARGRFGTLVLLGDLFESWVGPRQAEETVPRLVLDALARLARSDARVCFQAGNRDFLFPRGVDLPVARWPQLVTTPLAGRPALLTHGDLLCTADTGYQVLRGLLRRGDGEPRWWCHVPPYGVMRGIARGLRGASSRATQRKPRDYMDIDYDAARAWLDAHDADVLVAGHVHTGVHRVLPGAGGTPSKEAFVLLDWEHGGSVVVADGDGIRQVAPEEA